MSGSFRVESLHSENIPERNSSSSLGGRPFRNNGVPGLPGIVEITL